MVVGTLTMSFDWNVEDMTAKKFKQSCQYDILKIGILIDNTTQALLDLSTDPQSNGIEIQFLSASGNSDEEDKVSGYVWISQIRSGPPEQLILNPGYASTILICKDILQEYPQLSS